MLPRTYAWVIQIACSASAPMFAATCGRPTITIRLSIPAMRTPIVVTVSTVHLYCIRTASVPSRGAPRRGLWPLSRRGAYVRLRLHAVGITRR